MVIAELAESGQDTRDNIAARDTTRDLIIKRNKEIIYVEENTTIAKTEALGNGWIVGSATNGIVGINTGTQGGGQQVVGGLAGLAAVIARVVNPNNTFREHFRDETFKDIDAHNTADWNTTTFRLAMSNGKSHSRAYHTIATFSTIFLNLETVISVTINADETRWGSNDLIKYFLSADGGSNWEEVQRGIEYFFNNQGQDLRVKIQFLGQGGKDTYIENLQVSYTV